jgi:DNA-binding transcriptional LysR family regulator
MWRTTELREIRVFLALASELHFGRTAERLSLTQSRVSQTLRALETKLGDRLVDRTSRSVALTPAGERLRAELEPAYGQLLDVLERFARAHEALAGSLRLGITYPAAASARLLGAIDVFEARHPQCSVETVELPFRDRLQPLRRGEIDVMVLRLPIEQPDVEVGPVVLVEARVLAVARDHPLAARNSVSIEEVAEHCVVDVSDLGPREIGAAFVPDVTPTGRPIPRLAATVHDFTDLVVLIARGRVVQPTVASAAPRFAHPNVVCLPIVDLPPSSTALAWQRGSSDARLHAFLAVARELLPAHHQAGHPALEGREAQPQAQAEVGGVCDAQPVPRTPDDILPPGRAFRTPR